MLERKYDPSLPYMYVKYGRMSDARTQNSRSPDQQFATAAEGIARRRLPWREIKSYRDDGISGRYVARRPGLQQMLRDIEAGLVAPDLIVVDTYERLGRAEEIAHLRHKLFIEYGVMVVAADNDFADPTGVVGKAVGMVEQIRATENTRISCHNVIRGKKDAARQGYWPGGPPPFGRRLKPVIDRSGAAATLRNVLEVEPREAAALRLALRHAVETGDGLEALARWWNDSPEIPADFKPTSVTTLVYRLDNEINVGTLVWGAHRTGVVNDARVIERAAPGEALRVEGFCEAIVPLEDDDAWRAMRRARHIPGGWSRGGDPDDGGKLIAPQSPGLTLSYLLSGLARCGSCRSSLRIMQSGAVSKSGFRYVYYGCPRHREGSCKNGRSYREDQLRDAVVSRARSRLFPAPGSPGSAPGWLPELLDRVRADLGRQRSSAPERAAESARESAELRRDLEGWGTTLGNPNLAASVREDIELKYAAAKARIAELERAVAEDRAFADHVERVLDGAEVVARLGRLSEALATANPTLGNLELGRHIERIDCHADGVVELRGTYLGLFDGGVELLSQVVPAPAPAVPAADDGLAAGFAPAVPRRRARLRVPNLSAEGASTAGEVDTSLDPSRFAGLPSAFFWTEPFVLSGRSCWAEENAEAVLAARAGGSTMEELAARFGKSRPTIRHALKIAAARRPAAGTDDEASSGEDESAA